MKDWFGQIYVTKVTWAFCHIPGARLAPRISVYDTLPRVHKSAKFRTAAFHSFWKANAAICDGHPTYLIGRKNAELDPFYSSQRRFGVGRGHFATSTYSFSRGLLRRDSL